MEKHGSNNTSKKRKTQTTLPKAILRTIDLTQYEHDQELNRLDTRPPEAPKKASGRKRKRNSSIKPIPFIDLTSISSGDEDSINGLDTEFPDNTDRKLMDDYDAQVNEECSTTVSIDSPMEDSDEDYIPNNRK